MASRGSLGGLSEATLQAALLMDASGKDDVFLETVGVGQAEVDIIDHADTVVLVLMPGSGDSIQALKAGVMEIPDVIAVNKADHPLTDTMVREIRGVLSLGPQEGWRVPIVKTEASRGEGVEELAEKIARAPRLHRVGGDARRAAPPQPDERGGGARGRPAAPEARGARCATTPRCRSCSTRWSRAGSTRRAPQRGCWSARADSLAWVSASRAYRLKHRGAAAGRDRRASPAGGSTTRSTSCAARRTARRWRRCTRRART